MYSASAVVSMPDRDRRRALTPPGPRRRRRRACPPRGSPSRTAIRARRRGSSRRRRTPASGRGASAADGRDGHRARRRLALLASLRAGEDAAGVGGEEGGQQDARQAEEEEHPLAHGGVVPGDLERVGDVVDQVVLTWGDPVDGRRDRLRLRQRRRRDRSCSRERSTSTSTSCTGGLLMIAPRVALAAWNAGTISLLERRRADDDRVRHVEEVLELASTCGWRRAASPARGRPRR